MPSFCDKFKSILTRHEHPFSLGWLQSAEDQHISNGMKACAVITLVLVANTAYIGVEAWGGLFNRFSPEMLSNLGYGSHGGYMNRPGLLQVIKKLQSCS